MVLLPCSKCCGGDVGECWSCLTSSIATWGRIIYEAGISEINVPPDLMSQTFNCGIWPGLRLRFESRQTASHIGPYLGPGNWCNCGGQAQRGGAAVFIEFEATNEENNSNNIDPSFQPIIVFDRGSDGIAGKVPQYEKLGTACNTLTLPDGWETWQVEGFGQHEFSLNVLEPFTDNVIGTVKVQLRLTDKLLVQDLSDYPSNYFPINQSQGDGCDKQNPERWYKTVGSCKDTADECEDFCQEPPSVRQWFQKKPCTQEYPCAVNGKRVKPSGELEIDLSGLQADSWGRPISDTEGFTGTLSQFNSWVSGLGFSAFSDFYPEQTPQTEYPMEGRWFFRGCVEFWEGGPPPFEQGPNNYCERTGGNDLAGLFYTKPPDGFVICGIADPDKRPEVGPVGSLCSAITSGCVDSSWSVDINPDFTVQQEFTNGGFCTIGYNRFPPAGSEEVAVKVSGMQVDITVPAAYLNGSVSACGSSQYTKPDGTIGTTPVYRSAPVVLSGKMTMSYDLELWEEEAGTCCLPTGDCVGNSTEPACYELCGEFTPNISVEECKDGIAGLLGPCFTNTDYFHCWDFNSGQPPPTWTPAGPIGEDCDYETGPTVATDPTTFATTQGGRTMPTTTTGPGTHLKNMLAAWGIHAKKGGGCKCRDWEVKMNRWGSDCTKHMDAIVDHLQAEAKKRNLPFVRRAGEMLVKRAIKRFEKES